MWLKKVKYTLLVIAIAGLILDGGFWAYCKFGKDIASSKIVESLGGE